jgi:hypothetical protein
VHACGKDIFAHLATFLCKTYFITDRAGKPTDQQLSMASVEGIFNGLIQANKKRFLKSTTAATKVRAACPLPRTLTISNTACLSPPLIANQPLPTRNGAQDFFNGLLQDKSEEFLWKKGMVTEMNRLIFLRSLHQPKGQDNTEHEIVLPHVKLLCASFARAGTKEAAERKLAIKTLWIAAGRAGEPTLMSFEQLGAGPALPKLQPVIDMGVSNERLESMIDTLFSLHDASPPMLLRSGHLRPMMRASMASMIMYYPERFEAKEMHIVLTSMREAYSTALSSANDSHQALIQWSAAIMSQFKLDNLHLTHVPGHDGTAQVVEAVRGLAATVGRMHDQVTDVATRVLAVESRLGVQHAGVNELIAGVNNLSVNLAAAAATAAAITTAATATTAAAPTAPVLAAAVAVSPAIAPVAQMMQREAADATSPPPPPLVSPRLASPPPLVVAPLTAEAPPTATAPADAFSILRQGASRGEGATLYTITGVAAPRFFLDCMANGGRLPAMDSRRMSDADLAFKAMMAMANAEEKAVLKAKPRDDAHAGGIANAVVTLVLKYIVYAYETALLKVPRSLRLVQDVATRPPLVSSIKEHITKLTAFCSAAECVPARGSRGTAGLFPVPGIQGMA